MPWLSPEELKLTYACLRPRSEVLALSAVHAHACMTVRNKCVVP